MSQLPLFLFTYNCNRLKLNSEEFISKIVDVLPDTLSSIYVFGFQELCSILDGSFPDIANKHMIDLNKLLLDAFKTKYANEAVRFHTISIEHVGSIGLIAITPFILRINKVKSAQCGCGYFGSSMKGGVGLRLSYKNGDEDIEITFASVHLSAGEGEHYYIKRNKNMNDIMRSLQFDDGWSLLKPNTHCFILGDLNYRTTKNYDPNSDTSKRLFELHDQTKKTSHPKSIEGLVDNHDELTSGIEKGDVLTGFNEGCIEFCPTYKYVQGTAIYNTKRSPAWCDRILFQSTYSIKQKEQPKVVRYDSIPNLLISDHQPVFLEIQIPFQAPESIITNDSGYLKILPNERSDIHKLHPSHNADLNANQLSEMISGPTQIYMKATKIDYIAQLILRPLIDWIVGYLMWFGVSQRGRLHLLVISLIFGGWYWYMRGGE
ncbi:DNase I-like protein [Hyphopichia burtonii NRRL Y-1933]|uniref:DNase I-like protein n=1 Tax=Hyphopichia burtonii NRRL Y-1933 TaxID=984485 RepID=A0A1E4RSZ4_9ASCO|nr:DNase I-like protein [Hyphopichia burtonii NRRL Y-1933]ODV70404.1 DNase I-like protein [Hyphopichia burtonii NRRL Y-1933]